MKRIADNNIRLVFIPSPGCRRYHGAKCACVSPDEPVELGTPCCQKCGERYDYSHVEIKECTVTVHVRAGVAIAPTRSVNGVTVKVRDHDNH